MKYLFIALLNQLRSIENITMTEKLITSVKNRPCLWDINVLEYKDTQLKKEAWTEIAIECGLSGVQEAKHLWKKLRDGHRQAIRRKSMLGEGGSANKWKYEELMEFLVPSINLRTATLNVRYSTDNSHHSEQLETDDELDQNEDTSMSIDEKDPKYLLFVNKEDSKREPTQRDPLKIFNATHDSQSALEKFFASMCESTCNLPERLQMQVQRKLFDAVMAAKEEHYNLLQLQDDNAGTKNRNTFKTNRDELE